MLAPAPIDRDVLLMEEEACAVFVQLASVLGFPRSVGQIYGLLFIARGPLTQDEIATRLQISMGSASQGLRLLRSFRAVRSVVVPGERRERFEADTGMRALLRGFLRERIEPLVEETGERVVRMRRLMKEPGPQSAWAHYDDRVETLERWHRQIARLAGSAGKLADLEALLGKAKFR